ncbi:MAG: hypothetical protein IKT81_00770 [Clostridia bacterium]|nr:hypothetical protein [Clostridia bacterium]
MKYVNQLDYPEMPYITQVKSTDPEKIKIGLNNTVAKSGCGLCSAVMVASRLRVDGTFEVEDARQLSYDSGANHSSGTDGSLYFPAFAEKFNLDFVNTDSTDELLHCLRTGGAAIVACTGNREGYHGVFSDRWGHYIVAISEERDGRIAILDAAYEEGNYEIGDRKGKVETLERGFCRTSLQVLIEETTTRKLPFYLFWRK